MLISLKSNKETDTLWLPRHDDFHLAFKLQLIILITIQHFHGWLFIGWVEFTVKLSAVTSVRTLNIDPAITLKLLMLCLEDVVKKFVSTSTSISRLLFPSCAKIDEKMR